MKTREASKLLACGCYAEQNVLSHYCPRGRPGTQECKAEARLRGLKVEGPCECAECELDRRIDP